MTRFTKRKFQLLPIKRQHQKCAELLSVIYNKLIAQQTWAIEWEIYRELLQWMNDTIPVTVNPQILADQYHYHLQQAQISKKEHHFLPAIRQGDRVKGEAPWPIAIYLDHIRSAHNVGSIVRTVEAFSLGSLYFSPQTPFVTHKQVQDTAMGAQQWISCHQGIPLHSLPRPIILLETSPDALPLYSFIFPPSFTLVVGNEEYGCSQESLALADYLVEIPLRGHKNSLNVANALALVAGEINRQKQLNI